MQAALVQSGRTRASVVAELRNGLRSEVLALETAEARTRLHWIVFAAPAAWLAVSVVLLLSGMVLDVIGGFIFLFAVGAAASASFNFASSKFAITGDRLLMKTGFIRRNAIEIRLGSIEGIQVQQGFFGRMLGYGSIILSGDGGWQHPYHRISAPSRFSTRVERLSGMSASR